MGINFPNNPNQGQIFTPVGGYQYVYIDGVWRIVESVSTQTAGTRNRIVNGGMQVSQENGITVVTANGAYPADQWSVASGGFTGITSAQVATADTPDGNPYGIYSQMGTGKGSLAAGDYWIVTHNFEGLSVADLMWGTARAQSVILRFNILSNTTGTFGFSLRNPTAYTRVYNGTFTISAASVWQTKTLLIPGDTTGVWVKTSAIGINFVFNFASGTSYSIGPVGWQAGSGHGPAGTTNGAAANGNTFYLSDVGFYRDNGSGVPPFYEVPDYTEEEIRCMRYYEKVGMTMAAGVTSYNNTAFYKVTKRIAPALALVAGGVNGGTVQSLAHSPMAGFRQVTAPSGHIDALFAANARM